MLTGFVVLVLSPSHQLFASEEQSNAPIEYQVHPIGWVRKSSGSTILEINEEYQDALLGVDDLDSIWVISELKLIC